MGQAHLSTPLCFLIQSIEEWHFINFISVFTGQREACKIFIMFSWIGFPLLTSLMDAFKGNFRKTHVQRILCTHVHCTARHDFTGMHYLNGNFPYDDFFRKTHARLY